MPRPTAKYPESLAFPAPFPTLLPLPETSSQPRVGLEITVFSRGRVNSRRSSRFGICPKIVLSGSRDWGDFSARYKSLKVLNEYCPKGEQVGNLVGAASGTEKRTMGRPPVRIPGPPRVHPFKLTNALLEFGNTFWFPSDVPPCNRRKYPPNSAISVVLLKDTRGLPQALLSPPRRDKSG